MRLAEIVTPHDLKQVNLLLLLEGAKEIGAGPELRKRVRARAKMVSDRMLQQLLDEIPDVDQEDAGTAWSHWMALVAARQPFFDANHRTALMGFNLATTKAWGLELSLTNEDLERLMISSRKLVTSLHRPGSGTRTAITVTALRDAQHPIRLLYAEFEDALVTG